MYLKVQPIKTNFNKIHFSSRPSQGGDNGEGGEEGVAVGGRGRTVSSSQFYVSEGEANKGKINR